MGRIFGLIFELIIEKRDLCFYGGKSFFRRVSDLQDGAFICYAFLACEKTLLKHP